MVGALFFVPSWLSRSCRNHPFPKLVEPGCDEGVVRVETIPFRSWLSWAATREWSVSKPFLSEVG